MIYKIIFPDNVSKAILKYIKSEDAKYYLVKSKLIVDNFPMFDVFINKIFFYTICLYKLIIETHKIFFFFLLSVIRQIIDEIGLKNCK